MAVFMKPFTGTTRCPGSDVLITEDKVGKLSCSVCGQYVECNDSHGRLLAKRHYTDIAACEQCGGPRTIKDVEDGADSCGICWRQWFFGEDREAATEHYRLYSYFNFDVVGTPVL